MTVRKGALAYAVRMGMGAAESGELSGILLRCPEDVRQRVTDQLWLRAVLVEQRRRTRIAERPAFEARADRLLEALDTPEQPIANAAECGRLLVGRGTDTWDPICVMPSGHEGSCLP